jgi:aldose 1-epimerase
MGSASGSFRTDVEVFGELADGTVVHRYRLTNDRGMAVWVLTYGAVVQSIEVPDRHRQPANIVLGFASLDAYVRDNRPYFGAVVGRYANRIANGTFTLDTTTYQLPVNNPPNSLHGGTEGFDKRVWQAELDRDGPGLRLVYRSPTARWAIRAPSPPRSAMCSRVATSCGSTTGPRPTPPRS